MQQHKYDEISVRCLRALYSTSSEWSTLQLGTLERLGVPLSSETESKVNCLLSYFMYHSKLYLQIG